MDKLAVKSPSRVFRCQQPTTVGMRRSANLPIEDDEKFCHFELITTDSNSKDRNHSVVTIFSWILVPGIIRIWLNKARSIAGLLYRARSQSHRNSISEARKCYEYSGVSAFSYNVEN